MTPRPVPHFPRGRRRAARAARPGDGLLACPRLSPAWELSALEALMRPHDFRRAALEHRGGGQRFSAADARAATVAIVEAGRRLGVAPLAPALSAGDYHLALTLSTDHISLDVGRALAVAASAAVPHAWFTLDAGPRRLFVLAGRFHRRARGYKLDLRPARDVHLPRAVRAALKGLV